MSWIDPQIQKKISKNCFSVIYSEVFLKLLRQNKKMAKTELVKIMFQKYWS